MIEYFNLLLLFALIIILLKFYKSIKIRLNHNQNETNQYINRLEYRITNKINFENKINLDKNNNWIIVFSRDRYELLEQNIINLRKFEANLKIVLVDNSTTIESQNKTIEIFHKYKLERNILNKINSTPQWQKSFAIWQAVNLIKCENPNYIAWIDDDIIIHSEFLSIASLVFNNTDYSLVSFFTNEKENNIHRTVDKLKLEDYEFQLKSTFGGAFVVTNHKFWEQFGLPPINEGINDLAVEDWYYSRLLKSQNQLIPTLSLSSDYGANNSVRESVTI